MIRKSLMLTVEQPNKQSGLLTANLPSHLHVAAIMNESTHSEKTMFGQVNLAEMKLPAQRGV
jgi:hypothetical protein